MDLTTISTALSSLQTAKDLLKTINDSKDLFENIIPQKGPFRILCQLGKIENTKGHKYENRNRCRAIC